MSADDFGAATFNRTVSAWCKKQPAEVSARAVRAIALEALKRLVMKTPVDTGRARGGRPNVTVNVTNNSSQPVNVKPGDIKLDLRRMVVGIVLEDQNTNGPMSRGYKR